MSGQDYDKDLYIVLVGSGTTTIKNFVDNVEDYIFGPKDEREATLLVPMLPGISDSLGRVLNEWAIGDDDEPNYPLHVYKDEQTGHRSVAKAVKVVNVTADDRVYMDSAEVERAMNELVNYQREGNEVVVVVIYDEEKDVKLVGELKNYQSIPVLNLDGMIDDFPGFKTTDELLKEEREREEFETKEAIRLAAEKEQAQAEKVAKKAAASPRKRATAKPVEDKPLTATKKAAAPRKRVVAPKPTPVVEDKPAEEKEYKVGDVVEVGGIPFVKHSDLPEGLEPVRDLPKPVEAPVPDLWADVSRAQAGVSVPDGKLVVSKESLVKLGEGIKEMSEAYSKTISAFTEMLQEKK